MNPQFVFDLQIAHDVCKEITKAEAKNFYYAFRMLPTEKRRAIYAAYAYCRTCDDIADGEMSLAQKESEFASLRRDLRSALQGFPVDPVLAALADSVNRFGIDIQHLLEVINGVEMDLTKNRFADFEELREYCYKVASVVGLISIEVFGYKDPSARKYGVDLGLAMQITNIMRDVAEDAERDRIYLPQNEMNHFGYTESDLKSGVVNDQFRELMAYQSQRARTYFRSGARLFPLLSKDSQACPQLLHDLYSKILDHIEEAGFDVFQGRIGLSTRQKMMMMGRLWTSTLIPKLPFRLPS